jgi:methionine sulfoxide reductase heme-binding subunit
VTAKLVRWLRPLVFLAALAPAGWLVLRALGLAQPGLGANPVEVIQDTLGIWGLRLLILTLCLSPLARALRSPWPVAYRRLLGLFAFSYIALHFLAWLVLDQTLDLQAIVEDIIKRPFITVGFVALLLLVPLAVTSTRGWQRRLGARRWQSLHRLVYPAAMLGVWHFFWQVRADFREALFYTVVLALLLLARLQIPIRRRLRGRG